MPSTRRTLLQTAPAVALGLAGCATTSHDGTTNGTASPSPDEMAKMGTPQTVNGTAITVSNPSAQTAVLHLTHPDAMGVTPAEGRYVFVQVQGAADGPPPTAFSLVAGGGSYRGTVSLPDVHGQVRHTGQLRHKYDPDWGTKKGWVAFDVPANLDIATARIELNEGAATWELPEAIVRQLRKGRPEWRLADVSLPAEVVRGDSFTPTVVVKNTADVAGTFRGVLNVADLTYAYAPYPFTLDITAGGRARWTRTFQVNESEDAARIGLFLRTPVADTEQQVDVRDGRHTETTAEA